MTPEGKVKAKVRALLKHYDAYWLQAVQFGYGGAGLDFHCGKAVRNVHIGFYVETKAEGKEPTERQKELIERLRAMKARVFVVDDDVTLGALERYLLQLDELDKEESGREEHENANTNRRSIC